MPNSQPTASVTDRSARAALSPESQRLRDIAARTADLPTRCRYILRYLSERQEKLVFGLSPQAVAILAQYPWSGDLDELENVLAEAIQRCKGRVILPAHLVLEPRAVDNSHQAPMAPSPQVGLAAETNGQSPRAKVETGMEESTDHSPQTTVGEGVTQGAHKDIRLQVHMWQPQPLSQQQLVPAKPRQLPFVDLGLLSARPEHELTDAPQPPPPIRPLREALEDTERQLITQALEAAQQDILQAAELLHIPRQTLQYRMKALGIDTSPKPQSPHATTAPSG